MDDWFSLTEISAVVTNRFQKSGSLSWLNYIIFIQIFNMLKNVILSVIVIFNGMILCFFPVAAQLKYSEKDSIRIYDLLDEADMADLHGRIDFALQLTDSALELSRRKNFNRGMAFAWLKIADLKLKRDGANVLDTYYEKARTLAAPLKDNFLSGLIEIQQAQQMNRSGEHAQAENKCISALNYFLKTDSLDYQALTYNELGFLQERLGRFEDAARNYIRAITLFEKTGNDKEAANTLGNIAIVYYRMGSKEEALNMFKRSATVRAVINDVKGLASTYANIATVYLPINEDSAAKYYRLQIEYAKQSDEKIGIAQAYANRATLLVRQKKYSEALISEENAIRVFEDSGEKYKSAMRYISAALIHHYLNDSVRAEEHFGKAEDYGLALNSKPILENLFLQKSIFYQARNDYKKAHEFNTRYHLYKDSLITEKTRLKISELQIEYETEKKDNEIDRLKSADEIHMIEIERQAALLRGNKLEAQRREQEILLLVQEQKLKDDDIKLKEELLTRQALLVKTNEQQLKIAEQEHQLKEKELQHEKLLRRGALAALVLVMLIAIVLFSRYRLKRKLQEQQKILNIRDNISKDLHDEIGSTLTSINILSNLSQKAFSENPEQTKEMLQQISSQSKTIRQNMSDIVWALRPENDRIENLEVRMREFAVQTLESNDIQTRFDFDKELLDRTLAHEVRRDLLLIYKEAVNNIVKHARASKVNISFTRQSGHAVLSIKDNGIGVHNNDHPSSGTGTKTMNQRALAIGATLQICNREDGTLVEVRLPIP